MNEPDEYLNYINNDLVKMIGYKEVNEQKIELLLENVPLYFLLSFLGYASYKDLFANNRS